MDLKEYFENTEGSGILATADGNGQISDIFQDRQGTATGRRRGLG